MKWFLKCFKQYVDFEGRARRKEYWWFTLFNAIISMVLVIGWLIPIFKLGFNAAASGADDIDEMEIINTVIRSPFIYIYIVYYMAILIPSLAVTVRRLHDIGKSGFWCFLICGGSILGSIGSVFSELNIAIYLVMSLACMAIAVIALVWLFTDSQYGPNKYGLNPKGEGNPETPVEE